MNILSMLTNNDFH